MADALETVNGSNCKSKRVDARILSPQHKSPTDNMTVFTVTLVTKSGRYTVGEDVLFGDKKQREAKLAEAKKKWCHNSTWTFTNMTVKKKQDKFHGCPHGWILNLGAKGLKATPLKGPTANALPKEVEPPQTTFDLKDLSASQVVDFHAFVLQIKPSEKRKNKDIVEVVLADGAKVTLPFNFWEESIDTIPKQAEKQILYAFGAYLVKEESGGIHLAPRKDTRFEVASGNLPKAKEILTSGIKDVQADDKDITSLSKQSLRNFHDAEAVPACIKDMHDAMDLKEDKTERIFEVSSAMLTLGDPDQLLTKDGDRIYTNVTVSDFSASVAAILLQEPALILSNTTSKEQFVEQAAQGHLAFARGHLRLRRAPGKDEIPKLTVVCALQRLFEVPSITEVTAHDARIVPVNLSVISTSTSGKLSLDINGTKVLAAGALAVVKAIQDADTIQTENGFGIVNHVKDAAAIEEDSNNKVYHAVTSAVLARLHRYALSPPAVALVHITNIIGDEFVVADVWQLPPGEPDLIVFRQEIDAAAAALQGAATKKRKAKAMEDIFPDAKRVHKTFDSPLEECA